MELKRKKVTGRLNRVADERNEVMLCCQGASPRCSSGVAPREEHREKQWLARKQDKRGLTEEPPGMETGNPCHGCPQRNEDGALQMGFYIGSDKSAERIQNKWSNLIKSIRI